MKFITTFDNKLYEITDEQADIIHEQSLTGKSNGIWINQDYIAFASIKAISDLHDYHQPYTNVKELPDRKALPAGKGFEGMIKNSPNRGLERMAKGLKKFIESQRSKGIQIPNADNILKLMRQTYLVKNNKQMA